jgi:membrane protein YqaA with SNARE-associated domain
MSDDEKSPARPHLLRRLYDWTLHWADSPYGTPALLILSFAESSFFPVPPDVLLIALALGRRSRALYYALICSIGSVAGGLFGYWIGHAAWDILRPYFIPYVFGQEIFDRVVDYYNQRAFLYIFLAGFTPIPYKVFTIAAGVCAIPLWILLTASMVGRSGRFFLVGGLIFFFGERVRRLVDTYFDRLLWAFLLLAVLGFLAVKYL